MMNDVPHNKGVLVLGNGLGGGIQKADRGDKCVEGGPALLLRGCSWACWRLAACMDPPAIRHGCTLRQLRLMAPQQGSRAEVAAAAGGRLACGWHVQRGTWQPHAQLIRMTNPSHAPQLPCRSRASTVLVLCCWLLAAPAALHSCSMVLLLVLYAGTRASSTPALPTAWASTPARAARSTAASG